MIRSHISTCYRVEDMPGTFEAEHWCPTPILEFGKGRECLRTAQLKASNLSCRVGENQVRQAELFYAMLCKSSIESAWLS